jgi:hypothetical protein
MANDPKKLLVYVMGDEATDGHKFMTLRRTMKNGKGRYVTAEQFDSFGLYWPTSLSKTRDELALAIGRSILNEAGI